MCSFLCVCSVGCREAFGDGGHPSAVRGHRQDAVPGGRQPDGPLSAALRDHPDDSRRQSGLCQGGAGDEGLHESECHLFDQLLVSNIKRLSGLIIQNIKVHRKKGCPVER